MTISNHICNDPENHGNHICALKQCGDQEKIVTASENPRFYCLFCAARVAEKTSICQPVLIE